jgi:hypothetical protein
MQFVNICRQGLGAVWVFPVPGASIATVVYSASRAELGSGAGTGLGSRQSEVSPWVRHHKGQNAPECTRRSESPVERPCGHNNENLVKPEMPSVTLSAALRGNYALRAWALVLFLAARPLRRALNHRQAPGAAASRLRSRAGADTLSGVSIRQSATASPESSRLTPRSRPIEHESRLKPSPNPCEMTSSAGGELAPSSRRGCQSR